ncbi:MAG TPA: competence/damage-inducible protein A [Bacillota bacterium]|nr:competence/damage-inducible protein A [Bacillota bacterium]
MIVDLICIGNELLTGLVNNTNAGYLARQLGSAGIAVRKCSVVADDVGAIKEAVTEALRRSDAAICTGGLGPTDDDLTREAISETLERPLQLHQGWLARLEAFFERRSYPMPPANRKQALLIEGSTILENPRGTAPGSIIEHEHKLLILLPGPPQELQPMFEEQVLPLLKARRQGQILLTKTLKCTGLGESLLEEKIKTLGQWKQPSLSLVAKGMEVLIQLKSYGEADRAEQLLEAAANKLRGALQGYLYGEDEQTLAGVVADLFVRRGLTLAVAESCSGGLLADTITGIPGSSRFFKGGAVTYSLDSKKLLPGLSEKLLQEHGAVSAATAEAMARGVRDLFQADAGIGITGIAGPDSDASGQPVGLVYVAASLGSSMEIQELNYTATRRAIKERAVQAALTMLWRRLSEG